MATMSTDELISNHIIQPSTPTPCHLKKYNLSLIDQYVPPLFVPIIFFYPASVNGTGSKQSDDDLELLKLSLSETLVHFYPLAGRLKDNITVDCNDEGVQFLKVKIKSRMCDFLMEPDEQLSRLLPSEVVSMNFVRDAQVIVQVNMFECGAIAISLCVSHKISDISSIATFIRCWVHTNTMVRGGITMPTSFNTNQKLHPTFESAALFPPSEQLASLSGLPPTLPDLYPSGETKSDNKIVSKRFLFDSAMINSLRGKLSSLVDDMFSRPTRVEIVSALIWKSVMQSEKAGSLSVVNHAVNLRKRLDPPLQDASFGNLVTSTEAVISAALTSSTNELQQPVLHEFYEFICQLREEISKIKGDPSCILHRTRGDHNIEDAVKVLWMTSWCNLGFYEIDFGWGKPIWVTTDATLFPHKNNFVMNDTICGEGIEVWVNLVVDHMAKFQHNLAELLN